MHRGFGHGDFRLDLTGGGVQNGPIGAGLDQQPAAVRVEGTPMPGPRECVRLLAGGDIINPYPEVGIPRMDEARAAVQAGLALDPGFTLRRYRAGAASDNPTYLAGRERACEGMLMAGIPEG